MADDAHDERFRQHQELLEGLARLWAAQHALNQEQKEITQRLTLAIESIDQTLAQQAEYNADVRTTDFEYTKDWTIGGGGRGSSLDSLDVTGKLVAQAVLDSRR